MYLHSVLVLSKIERDVVVECIENTLKRITYLLER